MQELEKKALNDLQAKWLECGFKLLSSPNLKDSDIEILTEMVNIHNIMIRNIK